MERRIRYAVVGLGYIAQTAMLPAFRHAKNSVLTALVSGDSKKLKMLSKKYGVQHCFSYEQYDQCLTSGHIDAVYIALPNSMHQDYAERAARHGIHVLCEKPMAITEEACESMIKTALENNIKLMIAYRLHFEKANLQAVETVQSGKIGDIRIFNSVFTMQVRDENNIRLKNKMGGGPLYDIGIYAINASRYLFRDEPTEVMALTANNGEKRFGEIDEMTSAILKFPKERLATFTCGFGSSDAAYYEVIGTKGSLCVDPAYEYAKPITHTLRVGKKIQKIKFSKRDQFGPELTYFSDCVLNHRDPEPSGLEGLADVRIINALRKSAHSGQFVTIEPLLRAQRPGLSQEIRKPPVKEPEMIHAKSPGG